MPLQVIFSAAKDRMELSVCDEKEKRVIKSLPRLPSDHIDLKTSEKVVKAIRRNAYVC